METFSTWLALGEGNHWFPVFSSHIGQWHGAFMIASSNGNIFHVTGPLCGEFTNPDEFPTQRPVMWSFDVFFDLRLNKWLSKQPWGCWFEMPSWSLWRQCNVGVFFHLHLTKRLSKESRWWWFETPLCSLWHHHNELLYMLHLIDLVL